MSACTFGVPSTGDLLLAGPQTATDHPEPSCMFTQSTS